MAKGALTVGAIIEIVFRGIPALIGTPGIAGMFGLDHNIGFIPYVHAFGAVMITFGIMMFIASKVPERHTLVINMAILRFALGILAQAWTFVQMGGVPHVFWIVQMVIDAILVLWLLSARSKVMVKVG